MKPRANPTQKLLVLAAVGGLVAAYAYFYYLPGYREIADMKSQLAEAQAELQASGTIPLVDAIAVTRKQMDSALEATQKQLDEAAHHVQAWQDVAPSEHELAEVFEHIHKLTRLAETETTRFEPQNAIVYETFRRVPVSMEFHGNFTQLAAVLTGLENMREPIWLQIVEIQSTGQDSELTKAEISLDILADNLEDSDQENLSGKPITQEAEPLSTPL